MTEPEEDGGGECDRAEEGVSAAVVTHDDAPPNLEPAEHDLNVVALAMQNGVVRDGALPTARAIDMAQGAYAPSGIASCMSDPSKLLAALAEPTRLEALRLLRDGREHCVCELMEVLGASQSRMSRHMATLRQAGLVVDRRDAQWVRYRVNPAMAPAVRHLLEAALDLPLRQESLAA